MILGFVNTLKKLCSDNRYYGYVFNFFKFNIYSMLNMNYASKKYIRTSFEDVEEYEEIIIKRSVALATQLNQLLYGMNQKELFTYEHVLNHINNFMLYVQSDYVFTPSVDRIKKEMNKAKLIDFINIEDNNFELIDTYYPLMSKNEKEYNTQIMKAGYIKKLVDNEEVLKNSKNYSKNKIKLALMRNELSMKEYIGFIYKHKKDELNYNFDLSLTKLRKKIPFIKNYILSHVSNNLLIVNKEEIFKITKEIKIFKTAVKRLGIELIIKENEC